MDLNKVQIIGNVTQEIEVKQTPNGQSVSTISVATNRNWTGQDGIEHKEAEFHNIVAWGKLAEIAGQYLQKGKKVYIEGRLKTKSWEAQDGTKRYKTEIIAENLIMLNPKGSNVGAQDYEVEVSEGEDDQAIVKKAETKVSTKPVKKEEEINIEDIPF